jgi:MFS family permease
MPRSSTTTVFACFTAGYFMSFFFRSANAVIARDLSADFAIGPAELGLMTSLFFLAFAAMQLPIGAALDRYGPSIVTPIVMLLGITGAATFAFAPSFELLALGRALIGAGMACGLMGLLKAFNNWFEPARVATISGIAVGIGALGGLAASAPLAQLNALVGWRVIFIGAACITALAAVAIFVLTANAAQHSIPTTPPQAQIGGFGLIFRDQRFWRIALLNFMMIGTMQSIQTLWGGPYLVDVLGLSKVDAGYPLLALSLGVAIGYFTSGWLADRFSIWRVVPCMYLIFLLVQVPTLLPGFIPPVPLMYIAYGLFGYTGAFNLLLLGQTRSLFPAEISGRAMTACNLFAFVGTALIQWLIGVVIGQFPANALGAYPQVAYTTAFQLAFAGCVIAGMWYLPMAWRVRV